MNRPLPLAAFVILCIAQVGLMMRTAWVSEGVVTTGEVFDFAVRPYDPVDPFRGRYLRLAFEAEDYVGVVEPSNHVGPAWATLGRTGDGFGVVTYISAEEPLDAADTMIVNVLNGDPPRIRFTFTEFYVPEHMGPAADRAWAQANREGNAQAFVRVRVADGNAVIEDLYIDGMTLAEYLEAHPDL